MDRLFAAVTILIVGFHKLLAVDIEQWGQLELTFQGPSDKNPFKDYHISANFSCNDGQLSFIVNGFYDGNGTYRIRFMPSKIGTWNYITTSNVKNMSNIKGSFNSIKPTSVNNYGPPNVDPTTNRSFIFANGINQYFECGTTSYNFHLFPNMTIINNSLSQLKYCAENHIFNKIRFNIFPSMDANFAGYKPIYYPYIGTPPNQWGNYDKFDVKFWQHLDYVLSTIQSFNPPMIADLILFHPYDTGYYGFDCMGCPYPNNTYQKCPADTYDTTNDEFYLKYLTSRLGSYRNVWYNMCNEFSKVQTKYKGMPNTFITWDKLFKALSELDIYNKEISIHQCCNVFYNYSREWVTHFSVQGDSNGHTGSDWDYTYFAERWKVEKPVILDEVGYEGNDSQPWVDLSTQQETDRFWMGNANGNMVVHGDSFGHYIDGIKVRFFTLGDYLVGESWKYIGWFNRFMTNQLENVRKHPEFHELENYCYQYFPKYPHCNIGSIHKINQYYLIHFSNYENKVSTNYSLKINIDLGGNESDLFELSYIDFMNETITVLKSDINGKDNFTFTAPYSPYNIQLIKTN